VFRLSAIALLALLAACGSSGHPAAAKRCAASTTHVPGAPLDTILRSRDRKAPLVVALHFATGDGAAMEQATGLTPEARRAGFSVAYPTAAGADGFWRPTDLPKLRRTIAAIESKACVDRSRLYLVGWSNGGGAAARAACTMAGSIAALALFAPAVSVRRCHPARPVSVLEIHGTADPLVAYRKGRAFIRGWARRDGCRRTPAVKRLNRATSRYRWPGCDDDAAVEHLRLARGRHVELLGDLRRAGIDGPAYAWRFLSGHRLPS
jgi:poly(3-hydroxybutyrate) depolymerase